MSYAYKPLHQDGLGHAFANTLLYLDLDRKGFDVPVVPVAVNCYGSSVIRYQGGSTEHSDEPDPPSPSPRRCFEMGQATARALRDSPWRVVHHGVVELVARLPHREEPLDLSRPRIGPRAARAPAHRQLQRVARYAARADGGGRASRRCSTGPASPAPWPSSNYKADILDWVETWTFNAPKCMAVFRSAGSTPAAAH